MTQVSYTCVTHQPEHEMALTPLTTADVQRIEAECEATYGEMIKFVGRIQSPTSRSLFAYVLEQARINANDTVYTERASNDWAAIFTGSIESLLACTTWAGKFHGTAGQLRQQRKHLDAYFARFGITY